MRKELLWISIIPLLVSLLSIGVIVVSAAEYPAIYVDPPSIMEPTLTPGENFTISIKTDYTGDDIHSYQFTLLYNPQVLKGVEVTNGDLVSTDKDPTATFIPGSFNNTEGKLSLTAAFFFFIFPPPFVTSGPGTLANVTFTVVDYGVSNIIIGNETQLIGWSFTESKEYLIIDAEVDPEHIQNGYINVEMPIHNIAITNMEAPTTVEVNGTVSVTVTVENQGDFYETFDVSLHYDTTPLETETNVTLSEADNTTLTFTWNTAGVAEGTYTMKAMASVVPGEVETADNTDTHMITITGEEPTPVDYTMLVAVAVVAIIIIIAVLVYALKVRKPKAT